MSGDVPDLVRAAAEALPEPFAVYRAERDAAGAVARLHAEFLNQAAAAEFAATPAALIGRDLRDFHPGADGSGLWALLAGVVESGHARRAPLLAPTAEDTGAGGASAAPLPGDRVVVSRHGPVLPPDPDRAPAATAAGPTSILTALHAALDATTDALALYDVVRDDEQQLHRLRLVLINAAGAAPLQGAREHLIGRDLRDIYPAAETSGLWQAVSAAVSTRTTRTFRLHEHDSDGHWTGSWDNTIAPVGHDRVVMTWRDVSSDERRQRELAHANDKAWHAATHDALTGLANRALLADQLTEALWSADANGRVVIVYVDLDRFKQINDELGHTAGDTVLQTVASRLSGVIRSGDLAARVGGDEFVLLLRNVLPEWDPDRYVQRISEVLERPVLLSEAVVTPHASCGVIASPPAPRDLDHLLREADRLMYLQKLSNRRPEPAPRTAGP